MRSSSKILRIGNAKGLVQPPSRWSVSGLKRQGNNAKPSIADSAQLPRL